MGVIARIQGGKCISFDEKDIQTLVKLGLNSSQAKIFLTLSSLGVASVKEIAHAAKSDRSEAYRELEILQERALVEKILSAPIKYKSMALNEALRILFQRKNQQDTELQLEAKALLKKGSHTETLKEEEDRFSILPRDEYRKLYGTKVIEIAQKEIIGYTQLERMPITLTYYYEANKKSAARGVRYRYIAEVNKLTDKIISFIEKYKKEFPNVEIRFVDPTLWVSFFIYDDKEMNFATEKLTGLADSQTLSTNNAQLIKVIKDYFELRWNTAMTEYPKREKR